MPRRTERVRKLKRKNMAEDESVSVSHSESTNLNNQVQLKSRQCPVSARRQSIPKSRMVSDRRRTLRSCRRLIETETTSLPRSSREHSSSPDDNQQPDNPADTINSACQGSEEDFDQVQSPSRYLVSVVYPLTLEQELKNKDAEIVENSTVGIPKKVGELGEAEMSFSNHSNQMAGQDTFEAENVPVEKEPLAGEIQVSKKFEEVTNKNNRTCISRAGCSSPSFSLKLTEMVEMDQDDDEIDSEMQSRPEDTVNGYRVKPEFMPILTKIIGKYGDIAKNCVSKSVKDRSALLEIICGIISEFEEKNLSKIKQRVLENRIGLVNGIKNMIVDVEWLRMRLIEVHEAREILKNSGILKEKTDSNRKLIEESESALEKCEAQKKEVSEKLKAICAEETACKERLARAKDESTAISTTVGYAKSKVKRFLKCSVVNGLI